MEGQTECKWDGEERKKVEVDRTPGTHARMCVLYGTLPARDMGRVYTIRITLGDHFDYKIM